MKSWGIRHQVLLLAVVPTLTVSILLVAYFTSSRLQDLEESFYERGEAIALKLAQASEYGVFSRNTGILQSLASTALKEHDVQSVACYTEDGEEIASQGEKNLAFHIPQVQNSSQNVSLLSQSAAQNSSPLSQSVSQNPNANIFKEENARTLAIIVPIKSYQEIDNLHSDLSEMEVLIGWLKIEFDTTAIHLREYEVLIHTGILLLFGLSISGLHALQMGRKVTRPILEMAQTVDRIKYGDLTSRVRSSAYPELRILESGINTMAEALENAHAQLQNKIDLATANLRRSLETIEVQNLELELARQAAENASQVKSEFLANMSHEIRTPLNAVTGFIRLLQKTSLDEQQTEYLDTLKRSSSTLLSLINDVLDFSKIEAGKLRIEQNPMDIRDCVEETVLLMTPHANEKGLTLIPLIYADVPKQILADSLRLKQVLNNLLSNAIKFTELGSVIIRVMLEQESPRQVLIKVSVTDTGIGMTMEEQQDLFQSFSQATADTSRKFGGTGLGLVICKRLVEQMQGTIGLESTPKKGTTFWFTFQAKKYSTPRDSRNSHDSQESRALLERNLLVQDHLSGDLCYAEPDLKFLSSLRVLAVDDNPDNLKLITILLEEMGITVTAVNSGLAALEKVKINHDGYDIILMDIRMPEFDGIQTTHAIREFEKAASLKNTPIIALTAHAFISEKEALLAAGVDDYLMKPIEEPMLVALLQKWGKEVIHGSQSQNDKSFSSMMTSQLPREPLTREPLTTSVTPSALKVIDWDLGLKLAANKSDLANELFEKLINALPSDRAEINQAFSEQNWEMLRDVAHRLHGACCYCGVPALKQATQQLERALEQILEYDSIIQQVACIQPRLEIFNAAIEAVLEAEHLYLSVS